jgi:hypothetical protein
MKTQLPETFRYSKGSAERKMYTSEYLHQKQKSLKSIHAHIFIYREREKKESMLAIGGPSVYEDGIMKHTESY